MVCRNTVIYGFLGPSWVLIAYIISPPCNVSNWCGRLCKDRELFFVIIIIFFKAPCVRVKYFA